MQKVIMIAVQDNSYWIRPDQIEHIEPTYDGDTLIEIEVHMLSGEYYTIDDSKDIQNVMGFIAVFPDNDIPAKPAKPAFVASGSTGGWPGPISFYHWGNHSAKS